MTLRQWNHPKESPARHEERHPFEDGLILLLRAATLFLVAYLAATW